MKILITGGAGYIGSILVPYLLKDGYEVTVLDRFAFENYTLLEHCINPRFNLVRGDCRDEEIVSGLVKDKDIIIPLAALVGAPLCDRDKIGAVTTNTEAVRMLLSLRSKDQVILFPNTNSGYGVGEAGKFCDENSSLNPISLYGSTKVEAEKAVMDMGNCVCFRLATVFGLSPRMRLDLLVNDFVYRAVNDRTVVIFEGHFKRNFIHVRDIARVFLHGIKNFEHMRDNVYNVGLDEANLSKLELCEKIKTYLPNFVYSEARIGEDPDKRDYIVSNEKVSNTGFKAKYTIDDGIKELIKGFRVISNSKFSNV